jgi:hypothetical protein
MKISVLVPFGADDSETGKQRRRVWQFIRCLWADHPHLELVEGHDPLFEPVPYLDSGRKYLHQFSVSRALNDAAKHATGDAFLLFGADHLPDGKTILFAQEQLLRHPWIRLYDTISYASAAATTLILHHCTVALTGTDWHTFFAPCPGVLAIRRTAWDRVGGMDEAYEGWGYEDTDLLDRLQREVPGGRMEASGRVLHELHVPSPRNLAGPNLELFNRKSR